MEGFEHFGPHRPALGRSFAQHVERVALEPGDRRVEPRDRLLRLADRPRRFLCEILNLATQLIDEGREFVRAVHQALERARPVCSVHGQGGGRRIEFFGEPVDVPERALDGCGLPRHDAFAEEVRAADDGLQKQGGVVLHSTHPPLVKLERECLRRNFLAPGANLRHFQLDRGEPENGGPQTGADHGMVPENPVGVRLVERRLDPEPDARIAPGCLRLVLDKNGTVFFGDPHGAHSSHREPLAPELASKPESLSRRGLKCDRLPTLHDAEAVSGDFAEKKNSGHHDECYKHEEDGHLDVET